MNRIIRFLSCALLYSASAPLSLAWASWVEDGVPLCTQAADQLSPRIVSSGTSGAIVVWVDWRNVDEDIYAQRVDASGAPQWSSDGVPLCTATSSQLLPEIAPDGAGGAIVAWVDDRSGSSDIYVQRIDATGIVQWTPDGVALCTATGTQDDPQITSDGAGGAIIAWYDLRGANFDVYVQRISASGVVQWAHDGVPLCTASGNQFNQEIVPDGAGGAIVMWSDYRSGSSDIYAQKINALGVVQWALDGLPVCTAPQSQSQPELTSDGAGGAIMVWRDSRNLNFDIYAQRIDSSGAIQWATDGVPVCSHAASQDLQQVASDGTGGAVVAWCDYRTPGGDIYAQRIDASGAVQWTLNGFPACTAVGSQLYPQLTSDGAGGAVVTWRDGRGGSLDIYAQRIDSAGGAQWTSNGVALCAATGDQYDPRITMDGAGGTIITWFDQRVGYLDIYAQQVDSQGRPGYLAPGIHSVQDVPGDQGGSVHLTWDATPFDYLSGDITEYTVWRALTAQAAKTMVVKGDAVLLGPGEEPTFKSGDDQPAVLRLETLNGNSYYWELVGTQGAYRLTGYAKTVATLFDSSAVVSDYQYFQVIAQTSDPAIFYVSDPDSGYSVDNLAPGIPASLFGTASYSPAGMQLRWNRNHEPDLDSYRVYRGLSEGFIPGSGNLVASTNDSTAFDSGWTPSGSYYYKVSALDIHGNESGFALLTPQSATGVETPTLASMAYLRQNVPNPFNPATTIAFGLQRGSHVTLKIYDLAGRLVRVLADGDRPAGDYTERWDGKDGSGREVSSAVYVYRLQTGSTVLTRRMTLLK